MKHARFESKKTLMPAKPRGVAGLQVRSGVKAGLGDMSGYGDIGGGRGGGGGGSGRGLDRRL